MQKPNSQNINVLLCILLIYCSITNTALAQTNDNANENEHPNEDTMQENVYPKDFSENCKCLNLP